MSKQQLIKRLSVCFFSALLISFLTSCSTISSGKKYTLAKVNRNKQLVEPHRVLEDPTLDMLDQVNPTNVLGIVLNSGYLPYLHEVGRPEVAIFVTTKIRSKNQPDQALLWERVYLNSEAEGTYLAVNKDSFLPRKDITVLPPIIYNGQDILVSIRILELDQKDNERMQEIVATAAAAAATFQPQYAGAISVFQSSLNFIIANNADDIEFQYDFALSQSPGPITYRENQRYDMVLNPRINTYALIKTEHRERPIIPYGYAEAAQNGLRFAVAEILKFTTLGILNWPMWCDYVFTCKYMDIKDKDDVYHAILGRPFAPDRDSFIPPAYNEQGLLITKGDQSGEFEIVGDNVKVKRLENDNKTPQLHDFEDQAYLIFSVLPDFKGVDIKTLQKIANQRTLIDKLNMNSSQLGPKDFKKHLQPVLNSIEGFVAERNIREQCTARINKAETEQQVLTEQKKCQDEVKKVKPEFKSGDTMEIALKNLEQDIKSMADRQLGQLEYIKMNAEEQEPD